MYLGIDIGSSSSKAVIIDENVKIKAVKIVNLGIGTGGTEEALAKAFKESGITRNDVKYTVVTGYGRITYKGADKQITEITCHARGVNYLMGNNVSTVIDIGGQDAKVIKLAQTGGVENFVMNEKCAAGTGRFLEVMARVLGCQLNELAFLASDSTKEVPISSVCTVFAESEVISRLAAGEKIEDVARGAHRAIAKRIAGMCNRVSAKGTVAMTGGVALNADMVKIMGEELGLETIAAPYPQAAGAVGAAVLAFERFNR